MPEHFLNVLFLQDPFIDTIKFMNVQPINVRMELEGWLETQETLKANEQYTVEYSLQFKQMMELAALNTVSAGKRMMGIPHVVKAILSLDESMAAYVLNRFFGSNISDFMRQLIYNYEEKDSQNDHVFSQQEKKEEKEDDSKDFLSMSDDDLMDDSDDPFGEESNIFFQ